MTVKAFVTGGAGFIGSHLAEALLESGVQTHVLDNLSSGSLSNVHPLAVAHACDIRSDEAVRTILREKPDILFHLAAQADVGRSIEDPAFDADVNITGTINLLEACLKAGVGKIVFASTSAVYGNLQKELIDEGDPALPVSYYGLSKWAAENYIRLYYRLYGLPYTILRYGNVYGPRQTAKGEGGVIAVFAEKIRKGLTLNIHGDGEQTRDFIYVKDVARANIAAIDGGHAETIQVSTAVKTSVNEIVAHMAHIRGAPLSVQHTPARLGDIRHSCLDNRKAHSLLIWQPVTDLAAGLYETLR